MKDSGFNNYLLGRGFSTATVKRYVNDTEAFIKWAGQEGLPLEAVSYADILHYIQGLRKRVKQKTISININSLKHYYGYLKTTGAIAENPTEQIQVKGIKRKILYDTLSKQELETLYHRFEVPEAENHPDRNQNWFQAAVLAAKRNKVILGLMVYQGLGSQDLARITEKGLKLREGKIYISGGRQSNERELKLEAHQVLDMMEYMLKTRSELLQASGKQSEKLFISAGKSDRFSNIMEKLIRKLNRQNSKVTTINQIRASVITHWLKTYNLREVQYMAGHRFVSSTESYQINDLDDLQEEITKFHPIG